MEISFFQQGLVSSCHDVGCIELSIDRVSKVGDNIF